MGYYPQIISHKSLKKIKNSKGGLAMSVKVTRIKKRLWYIVNYNGYDMLFKSRSRAEEYIRERS